ncbi:ArnT family glycosyltransferase [Phycicoccus duodecadis]|uniref:Dolichyl-phosphate-mannose-protein mannosyltransferase n=1 Tax=Phycicoccus duodecadis TaxID=173053 RepID=A0A2N3YGP6_9MICO|nr:glycosyltransferase family 39 protein [Phycicoccus duodecadis]PKW26018.1 dolichyl-phosphate-mannose-protein mannosyltransferase [Phycicoccus duodecadis]
MTGRRRGWAALGAVGLLALLASTWHLSRNGWGNVYYAGIAATGGRHLGAAFFGSLEPRSVVSTDKPPLGLWPMMLSVRLLGVRSVAVLLPQALVTAAAVVLLGHTVRRVAGLRAGVVAAVLLAVSPVTFALSRYDDPDTMLLLVSVVAAWAVAALADHPRRRLLVLLGGALGAAFLTKWLAGLVLAPAAGVALWRPLATQRLRAVVTVAVAAVVSGLWWVAVLAVLGPGRRPFADDSQGSLVELVLGSNGFARLEGRGGGSISGHPGLLRLFTPPFADQVTWFLPGALLALVLLALDRAVRGAERALVVLLGGWLVVAAMLFSAMGGAMHPYYTSYLAAPAAGLLGLAAGRVGRAWAPWRGAALVAVLGATGTAVLAATGRDLAWLAAVAGVATVAAVLALLLPEGRRPRLLPLAAFAAALAVLTGPVVTDAVTTQVVVNGADPRAGWSQAGATSVPPPALVAWLRARRSGDWAAAVPQASPAAQLQLASGLPVLPLGGFTGSSDAPTQGQLRSFVASGRLRYVVLLGQYRRYPLGTPPALAGHPVAAAVDWARRRGCPSVVAGVTVLDLADRTCRATAQ